MIFLLKFLALILAIISTFVVMSGIDSIVEQNLLTEFLFGLAIIWLVPILSFNKKDINQLKNLTNDTIK